MNPVRIGKPTALLGGQPRAAAKLSAQRANPAALSISVPSRSQSKIFGGMVKR